MVSQHPWLVAHGCPLQLQGTGYKVVLGYKALLFVCVSVLILVLDLSFVVTERDPLPSQHGVEYIAVTFFGSQHSPEVP